MESVKENEWMDYVAEQITQSLATRAIGFGFRFGHWIRRGELELPDYFVVGPCNPVASCKYTTFQ